MSVFSIFENTPVRVQCKVHSKGCILKIHPFEYKESLPEFSYQEKAHKCSKCHYTTDSHRHLYSHKKSNDYSSNRVHLCSKCEYTFCTKNGITVHLRKVHQIIQAKPDAYQSIISEDLGDTESIQSFDDENMDGTTSTEKIASQTCQKCNYVGNKSNFSKHSCEKRIFFANDGGYCPNNCGFFSKIWSIMTKHLRTTCKFSEENPSQTTCETCNYIGNKNTV